MHFKKHLTFFCFILTNSLLLSNELDVKISNEKTQTINLNCSRKFVLTGAPGCGKSSIIEELNRRGFQTCPEVYTTLYNESKDYTVFSQPINLRYKLLDKQLFLESLLKKETPVFLDRSTIDIILFAKYFNIEMPLDFIDKAKNKSYDLVFLMEPLPKQYYKVTNIRKETQEESLKIHQFFKEEYKKFGYKVIEVPFDTIENRTQFILDFINNYYQYADIIDAFARKNNFYKIYNFFEDIKLIEIQTKTGTKRFFISSRLLKPMFHKSLAVCVPTPGICIKSFKV